MTWLIGDIQGCFDAFLQLKARCIERVSAPLVLLGDTVTRGSSSPAMVDWLLMPDHPYSALLGNHELHILRHYFGNSPFPRDLGWFKALPSQKQTEFVERILQWPFFIGCKDWLAIHGGIPPRWSDFCERMEAASAAMRRDPGTFFTSDEANVRRLRKAAFQSTNLRYCAVNGKPSGQFKGHPRHAPKGLTPWFRHPRLELPGKPVYFGHWAALGHHAEPPFHCIDGGCVWGRHLVGVHPLEGHVVKVRAERVKGT